MADSNNKVTGTFEAAQVYDYDAYCQWLDTEQHISDKDGKPLYYVTASGKDRKTTTDVTQWPVMRKPAAPSITAQVPRDWHHKLARLPMLAGREPESGDSSLAARYAAYLAVGVVDGKLRVPKELDAEFQAWLAEYEEQVKASKQGAGERMKELQKASGKVSAMTAMVQAMVASGTITQEAADSILAANAD